MIPLAYIQAWKNHAPWIDETLVEQDLLLCKVLIDLFNNDFIRSSLAFRGGTALHKLFLAPPARYSEDIDLVQIRPEKIKKTCDTIRKVLSWLDEAPGFKQKSSNFTFYFRFQTESLPVSTRKIKIEINYREHFSYFDLVKIPFEMQNPYFSGEVKSTPQ